MSPMPTSPASPAHTVTSIKQGPQTLLQQNKSQLQCLSLPRSTASAMPKRFAHKLAQPVQCWAAKHSQVQELFAEWSPQFAELGEKAKRFLSCRRSNLSFRTSRPKAIKQDSCKRRRVHLLLGGFHPCACRRPRTRQSDFCKSCLQRIIQDPGCESWGPALGQHDTVQAMARDCERNFWVWASSAVGGYEAATLGNSDQHSRRP